MTIVFSPAQSLLASQSGANYFSVFLGRVDDVGVDGVAIVSTIAELFSARGIESEIIAARIRSPEHVIYVGMAGAHIAIVPFRNLIQMRVHPLTDIGLGNVLKDWGQAEDWVAGG